jgi:nucleoid-associated protein YgaU
VLEVELGAPWSKAKKTTKSETKAISEKEFISEPTINEEEDFLVEETEIIPEKETLYTSYEVQKDDTLQKISKKFYGTYKKWKKIYDANLDIIKDPNRIKPGMTIKVPQE